MRGVRSWLVAAAAAAVVVAMPGAASATDGFAPLDRPGPAVRTRIPITTCAQPFQPGVDPATFAADVAGLVTYAGNPAGNAPDVPEEPPLRPYVVAHR